MSRFVQHGARFLRGLKDSYVENVAHTDTRLVLRGMTFAGIVMVLGTAQLSTLDKHFDSVRGREALVPVEFMETCLRHPDDQDDGHH